MKQFYMLSKAVFLFVFFTSLSIETYSQTTFTRVRNIFDAKCVSCHDGSTSSLNLTGTDNEVYARIVRAVSQNPTALAKDHKLIDPGYPERSFLLRKINNNWDDYYEFEATEGDVMPPPSYTGAAVTREEKELIRQWIMNGAPQTGNVVNVQRIANYYNNNGMPRMPVPAGPPAGQGFQIRLGTFFLAPGQEVEYYKKHDLKIPDSLEVARIDLLFNQQSHHFILFKFEPGSDSAFADGLRLVNVTNVFPSETTYLGAWTRPDSIKLPTNTAYFWQPNTVLDLNYHILNYSQDSILAADAYVNIYTQPVGTAEKEMKSKIQIYPPLQLIIPSGASLSTLGQNPELTFSESIFNSGSNKQWDVWMLATHTHKYGTGYNIYKRNPDGSKGEILYNGEYNSDYTFLQGFYDWAHPPVRYFEPLEPVIEARGFIHEAKFHNTSNSPIPVRFGLTTNDEMMLYYIQYVESPADFTGVENDLINFIGLEVYPNPYKEKTFINYNLNQDSDIRIDVYDMMGKHVANLANNNQASGQHRVEFSAKDRGLSNGVYIMNFNVNGTVVSKKIIEL
jgi:hypothetical protein